MTQTLKQLKEEYKTVREGYLLNGNSVLLKKAMNILSKIKEIESLKGTFYRNTPYPHKQTAT